MNILPRHKQVEVIAALCEGVSVRATERLSGVNRGTILSLGVRVGNGFKRSMRTFEQTLRNFSQPFKRASIAGRSERRNGGNKTRNIIVHLLTHS